MHTRHSRARIYNFIMANATTAKVKILSDNVFPVVGIGASAGGLDAFKRLLKAIPEDSGMAYILVQHLDPAHESILAVLLQKVTKIPVQEIVDNVTVAPDHIYIIPSNKLLTATDGILELSPRPPKGETNMPIDVFFQSLAEVHQSRSIGVVLSGTATDGTKGLAAIKEKGGITFAQESESAAYDGMPQSAVDAGVVDYILPPEKIPETLLSLKASLQVAFDGDATKVQEEGYREILAIIRKRRGVDFTYYKQPTIRRRIERRIVLSMKDDMADYIALLKKDPDEQDVLYQDLLIPVTQFYRDPRVFDLLCNSVFPGIMKARGSSDPIRVWVAGCSTGEEAYSLVMCMQEYLGESPAISKIQVFATDISEIAITKARTGLYKKTEIEGLSPARLAKFFTKTDGKYRINKSIRDACVFAHHNYLKDPPFANMDLISCRNSLIYIEPLLQKKALTTFHYALKEKGFLVLGKSETAGKADELFNTFDKSSKVYTRKALKGKFLYQIAGQKEEIFKGTKYGFGKTEVLKDDFQKAADEAMLLRYAPPGVVVNAEDEIVQFRGTTGMWLEQLPGKPSLNVLKMAREGLSFEIRNALHKVKASKQALVKEDIPLQFMGGERMVTLEVVPLLHIAEPHYLILFREIAQPVNGIHVTPGDEDMQPPKNSQEQHRITELQKELALAREDMRSIAEEQEASNEELQSSNEELLSGNEEMQSLNEELETSREETQTSNEELIVVNQELYDRNEQLNLSRLYAESIVSTVREPLIILTKEFAVKSANKAFYDRFLTTAEATEGKLLFELGNKQWNLARLRTELEKILPGRANIDEFEVTHDFPGIGKRTMLLNASRIFIDNSDEQSILLAIEDVTEKRAIEKAQAQFAEQMEQQVAERTQSLHQMNIELQHSNKSLEEFAYIASHDLQEPLRKIRTFSSLLHNRYAAGLPEEAKEIVSRISSSSERMSTLITGVLNYSKILHGAYDFEPIILDDVLDKILDDFELLIGEKSATIKREKLGVIEANPFQMDQLFCNLVSNALKFTKSGVPPIITVNSKILTGREVSKHKSLNAKTQYREIGFKDNGIGFDPEYAEHIFAIFKRLHTREAHAGTGIGLALCKTIVNYHEGEICASSPQNGGALFQVILPVKQERGDLELKRQHAETNKI
ncbi:MAG: chemotaxis protein CheB [Chitinophagaceae bacterium]